MAGEIEKPEVNYERVEIAPAQGEDDDVLEPEDTDPDSSPENEGEASEDAEVDPEADPADESPDGRPEGVRRPTTTAEEVSIPPTDPQIHNNTLKRQPDESPREFAMRLELTKTRGLLRTQRTGEVLETIRPPSTQTTAPAVSEEAQTVLGKYKPEELAALREVLPILAAQMGFVRKEELETKSYLDSAQDELNSFMERHPEYLPEKDPGGALWATFKAEFAQYKQPNNTKEYRRLFEKVHQDVFDIKPAGALPKVAAAQKKVQVASHAGASGPTAPSRTNRSNSSASGLRLDMLKGFDDETKDRIASRASGE